jgi:hypothetical protein
MCPRRLHDEDDVHWQLPVTALTAINALNCAPGPLSLAAPRPIVYLLVRCLFDDARFEGRRFQASGCVIGTVSHRQIAIARRPRRTAHYGVSGRAPSVMPTSW